MEHLEAILSALRETNALEFTMNKADEEGRYFSLPDRIR